MKRLLKIEPQKQNLLKKVEETETEHTEKKWKTETVSSEILEQGEYENEEYRIQTSSLSGVDNRNMFHRRKKWVLAIVTCYTL